MQINLEKSCEYISFVWGFVKFCEHIVSCVNPNPESSHDLWEIWPGPKIRSNCCRVCVEEPCPRPLHITELYRGASFYIGQGPSYGAGSRILRCQHPIIKRVKMIHQTLQPLWDGTIDQQYSQPAKLSVMSSYLCLKRLNLIKSITLKRRGGNNYRHKLEMQPIIIVV